MISIKVPIIISFRNKSLKKHWQKNLEWGYCGARIVLRKSQAAKESRWHQPNIHSFQFFKFLCECILKSGWIHKYFSPRKVRKELHTE